MIGLREDMAVVELSKVGEGRSTKHRVEVKRTGSRMMSDVDVRRLLSKRRSGRLSIEGELLLFLQFARILQFSIKCARRSGLRSGREGGSSTGGRVGDARVVCRLRE